MRYTICKAGTFDPILSRTDDSAEVEFVVRPFNEDADATLSAAQCAGWTHREPLSTMLQWLDYEESRRATGCDFYLRDPGNPDVFELFRMDDVESV